MSTKAPVKQASVIDTLDKLLKQIDGTQKTAAEAYSEPGGYQGATTHPSKDIDDRLQTGEEGSRSSENESDVKEDQGKPGVNSAAEGAPGGQDSVQLNIGTNQSATGEDSSVETESAKGGKEDGGTRDGKSTHPARTDNDELDGHKYAAARRINDLVKKAEHMGSDLLSRLAVEADGEVQKRASQLSGKPAPVAAEQPAGKQADAQAGAQLAAALASPTHDKQAQYAEVQADIEATILDGFAMAEKTAAYLASFTKAAGEEGEEPESTPAEGGGDEGGGGGGEPAPLPSAGGGEGGGGSPDEEALMSMLMGGEGMGAEGAMGGMGGAGGDPMAGGGGAPMAGGGDPMAGGGMGDPMAGGGGGGMPDVNMLLAALAQAGVTPEMFEAASAQKMASLAKQVPANQRPAQWQPKNAEENAVFSRTVSYIKELCGKA